MKLQSADIALNGRGRRGVASRASGIALVVAVWGSLSLLDAWYVWQYGVDVPFWDEWDVVTPFLTGDATWSWQSFWEMHNEHRLVIPKVLGLGLLRAGGMDFRTAMYANVVLLSVTCLVILWSLQRRRGELVWTDVLVPLVLLSWVHSENLLWAFQLGFVLNAVLPCVAMASLIALRGDRPSKGLLVCGVCALLAPLTGAAGTVFAVFMAPVFGMQACAARRSGRRMESLGWIGLSLAILAVSSAAFVPRREYNPAAPWPQVLRDTTLVMTTILGVLPNAVRPWAAAFCVLASGWAALRLAVVAWTRPEERMRSLGLLAVLVALAATCGAVSYGRSGRGGMMAERYATLVAPLVIVVYVVAEQFLEGRARRAATFLFAAGFVLLQWRYVLGGIDYGERQFAQRDGFRSALVSGVEVNQAIASYGMFIYPHPGILREELVRLAEARVSYFADINLGGRPLR